MNHMIKTTQQWNATSMIGYIIPDVPEELGVMDLQVKQDEVGVLTSTKPNNVTEDLDVLRYLNILTLNVGFSDNID